MNFASNDFNWTTVFNLTHNKNKIVSLNGQLDQTIEGTWFIHKVGLPYHTFYVKEFAGVNTQNGKAEYVHPEGWKVWQTVSALQQTLPLMSDKNE